METCVWFYAHLAYHDEYLSERKTFGTNIAEKEETRILVQYAFFIILTDKYETIQEKRGCHQNYYSIRTFPSLFI
jgi:hypothetical protein